MKVDPRLISVCEENGWTVNEDDGYVELGQYFRLERTSTSV